MTIKTPKEIVYYPVSRNESDRLMCWIPYDELKKMVDKNKVDKKILIDYPDGLDIEITDEELKEFRDIYGLKLKSKPKSLLLAYEFLKDKKMIKAPRYINGKNLDILSKQVTASESRKLRALSKFDAKVVLKEKRSLNRGFSKKIDDMIIKPHHRLPKRRSKAYMKEIDGLFKAKMTKGDEPFAVQYKLQRQRGGGK
jgi:hypothetical protein